MKETANSKPTNVINKEKGIKVKIEIIKKNCFILLLLIVNIKLYIINKLKVN